MQRPESRFHVRSHSGFDLTFKTLESLFLQLFNEQNACRRLGFLAISRLLDGDPIANAQPGWYLWLEGRAGGFLIEWAGAEDDPEDAPDRRLRSDFLLRYYPDPSEEVFLTYNSEERLARVGPSFDHTATPHFRARSELDPAWFAVGGLRLEAPADLTALTFTLAAQDHLFERRLDPDNAAAAGLSALSGATGDDDRRVPGWALSWQLVDHLIRAFAYLHRAKPTAFAVEETRGQRLLTRDGRAVDAEPDPRTRLRQLHVTLPLTYAHHRLAQTGRDLPAPIAVPASPFASTGWWEAAELEVPPSNFVCERCLGADEMLDRRFAALVESPRIGDFHV